MKQEIDRQKLIELYLQNKSSRKCAEFFNVSRTTIIKLLHELNICNVPIKYTVDETLFNQNTEQSFYWAGFLAADGCIHQKRQAISIGLSEKDKEHLEKYKLALNATYPIHKYLVKNSNRNPAWNDCFKSEISIRSQKLITGLERFNVGPRKTHTLIFPDWLKNHILVNHFMRGYFDGDGSFYLAVSKGKITKQLFFSLRGTTEFLTIYRDILEQNCQLKKRDKPIRINYNIGTLEYGGNNLVKKIGDFLYKDATVYMDRKHNLYLQDNHLIHSSSIMV